MACFIPILLVLCQSSLPSVLPAGWRSSAGRKSMGLWASLHSLRPEVHLVWEEQAASDSQGAGEGQCNLHNVLKCFTSIQWSSGTSGGRLFLLAPKSIFNSLQVCPALFWTQVVLFQDLSYDRVLQYNHLLGERIALCPLPLELLLLCIFRPSGATSVSIAVSGRDADR